jgi:hypothetical protein
MFNKSLMSHSALMGNAVGGLAGKIYGAGKGGLGEDGGFWKGAAYSAGYGIAGGLGGHAIGAAADFGARLHKKGGGFKGGAQLGKRYARMAGNRAVNAVKSTLGR